MPVSTTSARVSVVVPDAHTLTAPQLATVCAGAKAARVNHVTIHVRWNLVQPADAGQLNVTDSGLSRALQAAGQAGLSTTLVLTGPVPVWVAKGNEAAFAGFASRVARWAKDQTRAWGHSPVAGYQVWHWPNTSASWGAAPDPIEFADTLKAAYPLLKAVDPSVSVILGSLAPVTTVRATAQAPVRKNRASRRGASTSPAEQSPQEFLSAVYAAGARGYFDAVGYTPVSIATVQQASPPAPSGDSIKQSDDLRAIMVARGDAAKKLHWTVGYDTDVFTQTQQSLYLDTLRSFAEVRRDHVAALNVYTYRDLA